MQQHHYLTNLKTTVCVSSVLLLYPAVCVYLLNTLAPGAFSAGLSRDVSAPVLTPLNTDGATLPIRSEQRNRYVSSEKQMLKPGDCSSSTSHKASSWLSWREVCESKNRISTTLFLLNFISVLGRGSGLYTNTTLTYKITFSQLVF